MGGGCAEGLSRGRNRGVYAERATPGKGEAGTRARELLPQRPRGTAVGTTERPGVGPQWFPTPDPNSCTSNKQRAAAWDPRLPHSPRAHRRHSPSP